MRSAIILGGMSLVALVLAACGDDTTGGDPSGSGGAPTGPSSGTGVTGTGVSSTGSSTGGAGGSGSSTGTAGGGGQAPPPLPACYATCTAVADCVSASPLTDADNYACTDGKCEYLGCQDTSECTAAFQNPNYACETLAGSSLPTCNATCTAVADCVSASPLTDADNYACTNNRCEYLGCQDTSECTAAFQNPDYVCETAPGSSLASCYETCTAVADCVSASPLTDADNYACTDGKCEYLGCQSTSECTDAFMNPDYICE